MSQIDQRRKWHVSREISVDAIIAFMMACGAVVAAWVNLNSRLSILETMVINVVESAKVSGGSLEARMGRMEDKLDRIIERQK